MKLTRPRLLATLAIGAGAALAMALPAGAAVSLQSQSPPVQAVTLGNQAILDANGAVVFAPVKVVCAPGSFAFLSVTVAENVGGFIASGTASQQIQPCTGTTQSLTVAVIPSQRAFRKGLAFGQASLSFCDWTCHNPVDQHNIEIVKK